MYLELVKAGLVRALRSQFDAEHPKADFRNIKISIDYPVAAADYPGIWVQYADTGELMTAGIGHVEVVRREDGAEAEVARWKFGGQLTMTVATLSALECDRLYDELVKIVAFAKVSPSLSEFRRILEGSELVAMNGNFDQLRPSGDNAAPGTPWGTEEIIYEKSLTMDLIGEFVSDPEFGELVNLRKVIAKGYVDGTPEPPFTNEPGERHPLAGFELAHPTSEPGDWI